eukprot:CAMPEP_0174235450 /NCGR_PEP_ID=MMETSP0417-20130205/4880_1 /TAXON_ID=242541 /ORGANISM="Mayorella sp, Strain BSH-02190019" /LENGTH=990 /DNA_ID=CAMNT_0015313955 /DNA_START=117 /DNA_END=3089 /DNA_ORIENTATION=-
MFSASARSALSVLALLVVCLLFASAALASDSKLHPSQMSRVVSLHSDIDVDTRTSEQFHEHDEFAKIAAQHSDQQPHQFLVHLVSPNTPEARERVQEALGVRFSTYLPENTYLLVATSEVAQLAQQQPEVAWVGPYLPEYKLPAILTNEATFQAAIDEQQVRSDRILALLAPGLEQSAQMLIAQWSAQLQRQQPELKVSFVERRGGDAVLASAPAPQLLFLARWLAQKPAVHFLEPDFIMQPNNVNVRGLVQGGVSGSSGEVLTNNLLTGVGHIIGMGDSGIDWDNCFFRDSQVAMPFSPVAEGDPTPPPNRRFYAYYTALGNDRDDTGHGTQVAGAVIGVAGGGSNPANTGAAAPYNSMASGALVAFVDLNDGTNETLNVPARADLDLYPITYNMGARVHSFSWGQTSDFYSTHAATTDAFAYANPDFLPVFSAGNQGLRGFGTVNAPSSAKNVLSVGASQSVTSSFTERRTDAEFEALAQFWYERACGPSLELYQQRAFCSAFNQNSTPCENFQNVLCLNFEPNAGSCCNFPYFDVRCCGSGILNEIETHPELFDQNGLAAISSRGPAWDGRIKPDVVAPGERVITAKSDGDVTTFQCAQWVENSPDNNTHSATVQTIGTSVAAGHVAAAATLVREYLMRGFYPTGQETPANVIANPSAALVKALIINSGQQLGYVNTNADAHFVPLLETPNPYSGFGRVQLDSTLVFRAPLSDHSLHLFNQESISLGETSRRCVVIPANARYVKITLVWTDPAAAASAGRALVNNLDMALVTSTGETIRANNMREYDALNNVEQIYIRSPPAGEYSLIIEAITINVGANQLYSLVVSGDFTLTGLCSVNTCPFACSLRGDCTPGGLCVCGGGYKGIDCSLTSCPNDCNNNGLCDQESGTCVCNRFWRGTECNTYNPSGDPVDPVVIYQDSNSSDVSVGVVVGIAIGCFVLGLVLGAVLGGVCGIRYLIRRQKQRIAYLKSQSAGGGQAQRLNDEDAA